MTPAGIVLSGEGFDLLLWGGDQSDDWTRHDGLPSAICGAQSAGLVGNTLHHFESGGYTSLFGQVRSAELVMRWAVMAPFTPVMRTHEGNRPADNPQVDGEPAVLAHFAAMTRLWVHLVPFLRTLMADAVTTGLPEQRPLFLHFEADARCAATQYAYLYGPDLLSAPVLLSGADTRTAYLPAGTRWTHLWSARSFPGGAEATVPAPVGWPPVFVRNHSCFRPLFATARNFEVTA